MHVSTSALDRAIEAAATGDAAAAETWRYVRRVRHRCTYLQDQIDYALPLAIEAAEHDMDRWEPGTVRHVTAETLLNTLLDETERFETELIYGSRVVSAVTDAFRKSAQAQVDQDDATLRLARLEWDYHLRGAGAR